MFHVFTGCGTACPIICARGKKITWNMAHEKVIIKFPLKQTEISGMAKEKLEQFFV